MTTVAGVHERDHCLAPERIDAPLDGAARYGRMFELPALEVDESLLHRLGAAGGFCDGGDGKNEARVEAGWPFFGPYVGHDLTADRSPQRSCSPTTAICPAIRKGSRSSPSSLPTRPTATGTHRFASSIEYTRMAPRVRCSPT